MVTCIAKPQKILGVFWLFSSMARWLCLHLADINYWKYTKKGKRKRGKKETSVTLFTVFIHYKMNIFPNLHLSALITFCTATNKPNLNVDCLCHCSHTFHILCKCFCMMSASACLHTLHFHTSNISFGHVPLLHLAGLSWSDFLL